MILSKKSIILYLSIISASLLLLSTTVHAEELPETESITDSEQNERLNALEIRLEELGYQINEITGTLEEVQTSELSEQEERLAISDKLDLVIVALNDLINYDIDILAKADNSELLTTDYRVQVLDSFNQLNETTLQLSSDTVSGNSLVSQLDNTISDSNKSIEDSNTSNSVYVIATLGMLIGAIIGSILARFLKHD